MLAGEVFLSRLSLSSQRCLVSRILSLPGRRLLSTLANLSSCLLCVKALLRKATSVTRRGPACPGLEKAASRAVGHKLRRVDHRLEPNAVVAGERRAVVVLPQKDLEREPWGVVGEGVARRFADVLVLASDADALDHPGLAATRDGAGDELAGAGERGIGDRYGRSMISTIGMDA